MENKVSEDNLNRLSIALIEKFKCTLEEALNKLRSFRLSIICGENIRNSISSQAALLTAINTGKRSFLGGVFVEMPPAVESLINWSSSKTLNEVVKQLGGQFSNINDCDFSLYIESDPEDKVDSLMLKSDGWRGGVLIPGDNFDWTTKEDFAMGGVASASLGVCLAFLKVSGLYKMSCDKSAGLSFWRPDLNWREESSGGPQFKYLPKRLWLLGLGHLGQAYLWLLGLLYVSDKAKIDLMLQDYDFMKEANLSAGLLCDESSVGKLKTRLCAQWLEDRNILCKITERSFNSNTVRDGEEPFIALCGFDNAKSRSVLERTEFDLVIECGLGGELSNFDFMSLHTFPNASRTPSEIWPQTTEQVKVFNPALFELLNKKEECGILAATLAEKSISSSFVGTFAACLAWGELLRACHLGERYDNISLKLRDIDNKKVGTLKTYTTESSRNGFINIT